MGLLKWIKGFFMFSELIDKIESYDEKIRKLEIENSAIKTSLRIIEGGLDIKYNGGKK